MPRGETLLSIWTHLEQKVWTQLTWILSGRQKHTHTKCYSTRRGSEMLFLLSALYFYPSLYCLSGHNGWPLIHKSCFEWHVWNTTLLCLRTIHKEWNDPISQRLCLQGHTLKIRLVDDSTLYRLELFGVNSMSCAAVRFKIKYLYRYSNIKIWIFLSFEGNL